MGRYFSALFARKRLLFYKLKAVGRSENLLDRGRGGNYWYRTRFYLYFRQNIGGGPPPLPPASDGPGTGWFNPIPTGCCHVTLIYGLIPPMNVRNRVKKKL